jgi:photosystem II stability/assembly factor-like uncharacterized protein
MSARLGWLRRLVLAVALLLAGGTAPAAATSDFTTVGPWGFQFEGFAALPNHLLMGSVDDRVEGYRSGDDGATWAVGAVPVRAPAATVWAYLGNRADPDTIWLGGFNGEVAVSHDGGRTATPVGHIPGYPFLYELGRRRSLFVARTSAGIASSSNLTAWRRNPLPAGAVEATVTEDGVVLVEATDGTVRRSDDGGATYRSVLVNPEGGGCTLLRFAVSRPIARVYLTDGCGHAWRSDDGAATFKPVTAAPFIVSSMTVDAASSDVVYATSGLTSARTTDGGVTWKILPDAPAKAKLFPDADRGGTVYAVTDWGLLRSRDRGDTWASIGPHITGVGFVRSVARASGALLAGTSKGILVLPSGASTWRTSAGLDPTSFDVPVLRVDPHRPNVVFAVVLSDTGEDLLRSDDAGATWRVVDAAGRLVNDIAFDPGAPGAYWVATENGLLHTVDDGVTWDPLPLVDDQVAVLAGSPTTLLLGRHDGIWISTDGGLTQQLAVAPPSPDPARFWATVIAADPYHAGHALAQIGLDLERTDDGGRTWQHVLNILQWRFPPLFSADRMTVFATDRSDVVLASVDGGTNWTTTFDPNDPLRLLTAPNGIALLPAPPASSLTRVRLAATTGAARRSSVPIVFAARRAIVRARFRGQVPQLTLPAGAVHAARTAVVRVRVVCKEQRGHYCGGSLTVRQGGRIVGHIRFAISSKRRVRSRVLRVPLRHARAGAAVLELRAASPWVSRLRDRRWITLRRS